jgi:hypothetical protein
VWVIPSEMGKSSIRRHGELVLKILRAWQRGVAFPDMINKSVPSIAPALSPTING